jgi:thymidylate synthase (FAD)
MDKSDEGLIRFLMRERHGTPFEHNAFTFHVKAPLFVAREWMRHRIGSYNEVSGRYKEFVNPDFYLPDEYRTQVGKPGAYTFETWNQSPGKARVDALVLNHYQDCYDLYRYQVENGIAKEMARNVLPLAMFTQFWWTVNARSLMNFISLRNEGNALLEIREYAKIVEELFTDEMPVTAQAFIENGRVAP